jgi:hypothetical protein
MAGDNKDTVSAVRRESRRYYISEPSNGKEQYVKRYGRVFAQLHFNTCKEMGLKLDKGRWYKQVTKSAETSSASKATLLRG